MRLLSIITAYAFAALAGTVLLLAGFAITEGKTVSLFETMFSFILPVSLMFGAPIAVPLIAFTEFRKWGDWRVFAAAGAVLGIAIYLVFVDAFEPLVFTLLLSATIVAALTYWLVAWRISPPKVTEPLNRIAE